MRRLFSLCFVLLALQGWGQTTTTADRVVARQSLYLRDWWVDSVGRDTAFAGKTRVVPTADAVHRYVTGRLSAPSVGVSWDDIGGKPTTLSGYGITDATPNARAAISLTTTGSAGAATYNSATGVLNVPQYATPLPTLSTLTYGATTIWNYATQGTEAKVTLTGNTTLSLTNLPAGVAYLTLEVVQDATGSRTLTLPAGTKVIGGGAGAVTLTTTGAARDLLTFRWDGTTLFCNYGKNYN
jgi:hypothetical protein